MDFIKQIVGEVLVVCNEQYKKQFIFQNKLLNIKIMNFNEFIRKYYFDYKEDAILYIMEKLNVKYEVALIYMKNLYYIKDVDYPVKKLMVLKELKQELVKNNKIIFNNLFHEYLKRVKVIFYDLDLEEFFLNDFKSLNYQIVIPELIEYEHQVIEFSTMEEEVAFVAYQISDLLYHGVSIEHIKLTNVDADYYNTLERIFSLHNLKVMIPYKTTLSSYQYVKDFINNYLSMSLEEAVDKLDTKHPLYDKLLNAINKYISYNNRELLIKKLSLEYVEVTRFDNSIEIVDYLTYYANDEDYVFMLSFNDRVIPKSIKDTEYITDNIKKYVNLEDTRKKNVKLRKKILERIKNIKNLTITYKLQDFKGSFYPSTLCSSFEVIKNSIDYPVSYSEKYNKLKLASCLDNYIKYGCYDTEYDKLNANFEIKYNSYNNEYQLINRVMDKLTLSYSKMNIYNKCAFRYYLSEILKLDIFEENFSTTIGSMVHYVMEQCLKNNDMDANKYACQYLKDKIFTNKELFFLEKYKQAVGNLLQQVLYEKDNSSFEQALYEENIIVEYDDNIKFKGIIDKILYTEMGDKTIISLIDYKTGRDDISLKYLKYGINIQLPIYLYLANYLNLRKIVYSGFYLQKLNITQNDYRLEGYSNSDQEILQYMDKNYENSKIIKGMRVNKDGSFSKNAKVLSNEEISKIISITNQVIETTIDNIKNNQFSINPKKDNDKIIGCEYCSFRDICFVKHKDYQKITEISLEEIE